jgi:hypothetical protein
MLKVLSICVATGLGAVAMAAAQTPPAQTPPAQTPPAQTGPVSPEPVVLKVGDQAPGFSLPGSDGKTHRLSDYKGKTVVLAWFPKAFTGG